MRPCGGCEGLGAHRRWCPVVVGRQASRLGEQSEQAEALGDSVGPNEVGAANHLWQAAALLNVEAVRLKAEYQRQETEQ